MTRLPLAPAPKHLTHLPPGLLIRLILPYNPPSYKNTSLVISTQYNLNLNLSRRNGTGTCSELVMAMEYERRGSGSGGFVGCFSCCFGGGEEEGDGDGAGERAARALRTSSRWMRERAGELPELVARVGRPRRRQQAAGEFRYDPISYALNFEEDGAGEGGSEEEPFKYRAFSSRLPASPPPCPPDAAVALDRGS